MGLLPVRLAGGHIGEELDGPVGRDPADGEHRLLVDPATIVGIFSLLLWRLTIITMVKYVSVSMSLANDREGGILALMSLVKLTKHRRAISVLSALAGAATLGCSQPARLMV